MVGRPVCRYFGGKWKLAPWVIENLPPHSVYVEPFGGAASVLLRKNRVQTEIYNDLDKNIVNIFRVLRNKDQAKELQRRIYLTPFSREDYEIAFKLSDDPVEQALRFIVRSFFGYGSKACKTSHSMSGFRSKRKGDASPAVDWANYSEAIPKIIERLRGVVIENKPALDIIGRYDDENALFYVDPPYVHDTRKLNSGGTYVHEMSDREHAELSKKLHEVKGCVVLSGYDSELYRELYKGWKMISKKHYSENAIKRIECLWICPKSQEKMAVKQLKLF